MVISSMDARGEIGTAKAAVHLGVGVDITPAFSKDEAIRRALSRQRLETSQLRVPASAELVVFPTRFQDDLKFLKDPASGLMSIDHEYSVATEQSREPYRLAYHVSLRYRTPGNSYEAREFIIDATTGTVLKKWEGLQRIQGVPVKAPGLSQYSGAVTLDAMKSSDTGAITLKDMTRGTMPHPWAAFNPDFTPLTTPGILTGYYDAGAFNLFENPDEGTMWGDGAQYRATELFNSPNGQTAAVDAHFGFATTWDFLGKVFGRLGGIDDQGTSPLGMVHLMDEYGGFVPNASYDPSNFLMLFGDGGYGWSTFTSLDIIAHELTHGVCSTTANLIYEGESGGLNEANSDILGILTTFWARGGDQSTGFIPDTGGTWLMGDQIGPTPIRTLYKPSIDGYTLDAWFDGLNEAEVHDASGLGSRFFYFLAMGTGADPDHRSPYLPGGMTGIGNDSAGRIWYRALTAYMTPETNYHAAREATLQAAEELYGRPSPAYTAVGNAWTAVNVNPASVRVLVPDSPGVGRRWLVPAGTSTQLEAVVQNAQDPTTLWANGAPGYFNGGQLTESGLFMAPRTGGNGYGVTVKSKQDPLQFAFGITWVSSLDCDNDLEMDTADMGVMALNYLNGYVRNSGADLTNDNLCEDLDILVWTRTFATAYGK